MIILNKIPVEFNRHDIYKQILAESKIQYSTIIIKDSQQKSNIMQRNAKPLKTHTKANKTVYAHSKIKIIMKTFGG